MGHVYSCIIATLRDGSLPDEAKESKIFTLQVQFSEASTESVLQLALSCVILQEFGLPTDLFQRNVQILSLIGSVLSITIQFAKVSHFLTRLSKLV